MRVIDHSKIKITMCMSVFNTSHLLKRSIHTWYHQTMDVSQYELIIVNDNSDDDPWPIIEPYMDLMNIRYIHLRHKEDARGGFQAFNLMYKIASGEIIAETTPEIMVRPDTLQGMYDLHEGKTKRFVTLKTYNLTREVQLKIDEVEWLFDIYNISKIDGWNDPWIQQNVEKTAFRTHQISSYRKKDFFELWGGNGFFSASDYGSSDPKYSGLREENGWEDYVWMDNMPIHQWHPPYQWRMSLFPQNYLNKWAHTIRNVSGDPRIPEGGTCQIWDHGKHDWFTEEEIADWRRLDKEVYATGYVNLHEKYNLK